MPVRPSSSMACCAACTQVRSTLRVAFSWASSIRAGSMRPSATNSTSACRAASRRTGSKQLNSTRPGVSSTIRVTPVSCSKARMLRPSRPMMRPFMSSLGRSTLVTTASDACPTATRSIAMVTTRLASASARWITSSEISLARCSASSRASCSAVASTSARASETRRPPIRSSSASARAVRSACSVRTAARCSRSASSRSRSRWMPAASSESRSSRTARRCSRSSRRLRLATSSARPPAPAGQQGVLSGATVAVAGSRRRLARYP